MMEISAVFARRGVVAAVAAMLGNCGYVGEAPLWVREKWVGLELPLAQKTMEPLRLYVGSGVLTGPKTWIAEILTWLTGRLKPESGFLAGVVAAVEILERTSPEAAAWWRENAGYLMHPRKTFLFQADCCHVISGVDGQALWPEQASPDGEA
jgi:hypothetical protein